MSASEKFTVFGPPTGSTLVQVHVDRHDRLVLDVSNNFGNARGVLHRQGARELRDALISLLGDEPGVTT